MRKVGTGSGATCAASQDSGVCSIPRTLADPISSGSKKAEGGKALCRGTGQQCTQDPRPESDRC